MTQLVISIEITIEDDKNNTKLLSVKDSQGGDITDEFKVFCKKNSLPIESQANIESAAVNFSKVNANRLL